MIKYFKVSIIILSLICLIGCDNIKFEKYDDKNLNIGIIGEISKVRKDNITFNKIGFEDLKEENILKKYDAVFITKDNLSEASREKYAHIYKECRVPFFFIENTKGHVPFTYDDISYEDADQAGNPPAYATGIYMKGNKLLSIEYGLYNDIENEKNIEDVYSRIFKTISENKV